MSNLGDASSVPAALSKTLASSDKKITEVANKLISTGKQQVFNKLSSKATVAFTSSKLGKSLSKFNKLSGSSPSSSQLAGLVRSNIPNEYNQSKTIITLKTYSQQDRQTIKFLANPVISDSRDAMYDSISVSHHPGEMLKYKTTNSRTWSLNGVKLVSRTAAEATDNLKKLNMIRSWVMPYYGQGTAESFDLMFGAPPPVLLFSAYGPSNIDEHPVVLLNYNFTYPNDVDYIECQTDMSAGIERGTPFPAICEISLNLKESFSPAQFSGFDLSAYRNGRLSSAYVPRGPVSPPINIKSSLSITEGQLPISDQTLPTSSITRPLSDARFEAATAASVEETEKPKTWREQLADLEARQAASTARLNAAADRLREARARQAARAINAQGSSDNMALGGGYSS